MEHYRKIKEIIQFFGDAERSAQYINRLLSNLYINLGGDLMVVAILNIQKIPKIIILSLILALIVPVCNATDVEQFDGLKTQLPTATAGRIDRGYIVDNGGAALSRKKLDDLVGNVDDSDNPVLLMDKMTPFYINQSRAP